MCDIEHPIKFLSSVSLSSLVLKVFFIEFPKILLTSLFLSNLVIEVSLIVKVDWEAVNLLIKTAFEDKWFANPQLVIIFVPSIKYSKDKGPDW